MIAPGFESHQCLTGTWKRQLGCHAGRQEVGRCHTRGESQGMCNVTHMPPLSSNKAEPTLALKPRGLITRSPKQGYTVAPQKGLMSSKNLKKKKKFKSSIRFSLKILRCMASVRRYILSWYHKAVVHLSMMLSKFPSSSHTFGYMGVSS